MPSPVRKRPGRSRVTAIDRHQQGTLFEAKRSPDRPTGDTRTVTFPPTGRRHIDPRTQTCRFLQCAAVQHPCTRVPCAPRKKDAQCGCPGGVQLNGGCERYPVRTECAPVDPKKDAIIGLASFAPLRWRPEDSAFCVRLHSHLF